MYFVCDVLCFNIQNHSDVRGESTLEGEIQQVEDLMLMEALRLSVLEEQARRERWVYLCVFSPDRFRLSLVVAALLCGGNASS